MTIFTVDNQNHIDIPLGAAPFYTLRLDLLNLTSNTQFFARTSPDGVNFSEGPNDYEWSYAGGTSHTGAIKLIGAKLANAIPLFPKVSNSPQPRGGRLLSKLEMGRPSMPNKFQINFMSSAELNDGGAFGWVTGAGIRDSWVPILAIRIFLSNGAMSGVAELSES